MLTFSVLLLAAVIAYWGWRFTRVFAAFGIVLERALNRAAVRSGEPPITTPEDEAMFR